MRKLWSGIVFVSSWGCGGTAADPGPSARSFDFTVSVDTPSVIAVLVIDDRATPEAIALRAGVGDAVKQLASDLIGASGTADRDRAAWTPVDLRILLAPASATGTDAIASPVTDPALAWTTVQATQDGVDALGTAVAAHVSGFGAPESAFRPLARARDIFTLISARRAPADAAEASLLATVSQRTPDALGIAVVAASDDEDTAPPMSFWEDAPPDDAGVAVGLVTSAGPGAGAALPRLQAWADDRSRELVAGCEGAVQAPFSLFPRLCVDAKPRCDGLPVALTAPGLGQCAITVTTLAPDACAANRGWLDPADANGVRHPQTTSDSARLCDVEPVAADAMDASIHDADCAGCGSGWCVTELFQAANRCPRGSMPSPIRLVGGALPIRGSVSVACREPDVR